MTIDEVMTRLKKGDAIHMKHYTRSFTITFVSDGQKIRKNQLDKVAIRCDMKQVPATWTTWEYKLKPEFLTKG